MVLGCSCAGLYRATSTKSCFEMWQNFAVNCCCTFRTCPMFWKCSSALLQVFVYHPNRRQHHLPPAIPHLFFSEIWQELWSPHKKPSVRKQPFIQVPCWRMFCAPVSRDGAGERDTLLPYSLSSSWASSPNSPGKVIPRFYSSWFYVIPFYQALLCTKYRITIFSFQLSC